MNRLTPKEEQALLMAGMFILMDDCDGNGWEPEQLDALDRAVAKLTERERRREG